MFVIESAVAGCGIPNDSLRKNISLLLAISRGRARGACLNKNCTFSRSRQDLQPFCGDNNICVDIYTRPRISQRDFPVMHFVAPQDKSRKMMDKE